MQGLGSWKKVFQIAPFLVLGTTKNRKEQDLVSRVGVQAIERVGRSRKSQCNPLCEQTHCHDAGALGIRIELAQLQPDSGALNFGKTVFV